MSFRIGPVEIHPIGAGDQLACLEAATERSKARLADFQLGLGSNQRAWWRLQATLRRDALLAEQEHFGLLPYEAEELLAIEAMLDG
jgi:hypothetical protein